MEYILRRHFCCVVRYLVAFCYQIMKRRIAHFLTNTCVYCLNFKSRNKNTGENNSYKNTFSLIKSCSREIYFGLLEWNKKCTINNGLCKTLKLKINCKLYYTFYIFTFMSIFCFQSLVFISYNWVSILYLKNVKSRLISLIEKFYKRHVKQQH